MYFGEYVLVRAASISERRTHPRVLLVEDPGYNYDVQSTRSPSQENNWYVINYNDFPMAFATWFVSLLVEFTPVLAEVRKCIRIRNRESPQGMSTIVY